jgi:DNA-directed RNA polymerase subunit alpha
MSTTVANIEELMAQSYENYDEMYVAIRDFASLSAADREQLSMYVEEHKGESDKAMALKFTVAAFAVDNYELTLAIAKSAVEGMEKHWVMAKAYKGMENYSKAMSEVEKALAKGWDQAMAMGEKVELLRLSDDLDKAAVALEEMKSQVGDSIDYDYQAGELAQINGFVEEALDHMNSALEKDPLFLPAIFRYAFLLDLNGDEEKAMGYYQECLKQTPIHVNAMINLSVLYDDIGEYSKAKTLLEGILEVFPNHGRARLFMKDVDSSLNMYYDEEYEKKRDKFQQVLDMPISDFELSVRSRNCLKKMGIRTLGDLTRITEPELLSYKNFGETSLNEIKAILTSKGLRLGQAVEDKSAKKAVVMLPGNDDEMPSEEDQIMMNKTIDELNFSVRSKKCLQRLNVNTLGELMSYSENELMSVKNFGSISLTEVKEKLTELGLGLRDSEL